MDLSTNPFRRAVAALRDGAILGALIIAIAVAASTLWGDLTGRFTTYVPQPAFVLLDLFAIGLLSWSAADHLVAMARVARRVPAPIAAMALAVPADDIVSQVEGAIIQFFSSIWAGISSFFGQIFNSIAQALSSVFLAPVAAIQSSFVSLQNWSNQFGPLAPLITVGIVAVVFLLMIWLIWVIIRFTVHSGETTVGEIEEGA